MKAPRVLKMPLLWILAAVLALSLVASLFIGAVMSDAVEVDGLSTVLALDGSVASYVNSNLVTVWYESTPAPPAVDAAALDSMAVAVLLLTIATGLAVVTRRIHTGYTHSSTGHSSKGRAGFPLRGIASAPVGA